MNYAAQVCSVQGSTVVASTSAHHRISSFAFGNLETWISSTSCLLTSMGLGKSPLSLATTAPWERDSWTEGQTPTTMWWVLGRKSAGYTGCERSWGQKQVEAGNYTGLGKQFERLRLLLRAYGRPLVHFEQTVTSFCSTSRCCFQNRMEVNN